MSSRMDCIERNEGIICDTSRFTCNDLSSNIFRRRLLFKKVRDYSNMPAY